MLTDQIFPLLAALPPKLGAAAMTARSACTTVRTSLTATDFVGGLGLVIGIAVGNTITQDRLRRELPASLVQPLLDGQQQITFGLINRLSALCVDPLRLLIDRRSDAPTQALVHDAMGAAFRALWLSIAGICGLGVRHRLHNFADQSAPRDALHGAARAARRDGRGLGLRDGPVRI